MVSKMENEHVEGHPNKEGLLEAVVTVVMVTTSCLACVTNPF